VNSKEIDIKDPYPWTEQTSLVIYAANSLDDDPDDLHPSLIFHDYEMNDSDITADGAPYLTALSAADMMADIVQWKEKRVSIKDYRWASETEEWVRARMGEGWDFFMYEIEPTEYAGRAYAWSKYAEQNK